MKTLYVTYVQNGTVKKGAINEQRYSELQNDSNISNVIVYPNQLIMENNYNAILTGGGSGRTIMLD